MCVCARVRIQAWLCVRVEMHVCTEIHVGADLPQTPPRLETAKFPWRLRSCSLLYYRSSQNRQKFLSRSTLQIAYFVEKASNRGIAALKQTYDVDLEDLFSFLLLSILCQNLFKQEHYCCSFEIS